LVRDPRDFSPPAGGSKRQLFKGLKFKVIPLIMKIFYIINSRIPSEKAEGLEAMKLCEALSEEAELVFVAPRRFNHIKTDPFEFYDIKKKFKLVKLPVIDTVSLDLGNISYWIEAASYACALFFYILFKTGKEDIIFSHDAISIYFLANIRKNTFYDIHDYPKGKLALYRRLFDKVKGITTTNLWKKTKIVEQFTVPEQKIIYHPNGVELKKFDLNISQTDARAKTGLPEDKILIGYVGMLKTMGMEKGIDIAIKSLSLMEDKLTLVLVGGRPEDIEHYRLFAHSLGLSDRVIFCGWTKHDLIPVYLKAFDVLIAPFPKTDHYEFFMSPMKIIEYMASRRPIVATDLNSIRELAGNGEALLVEPDSPQALADGIKKIVGDPELGKELADKAFVKVQEYAWEARAGKILELMEK
jgi:glycosyltransferase involved in cell wall biosynthesis